MKTKTKRIYLLIFALVTMLTSAKADPAFPYAYIENDSILCFTVGALPETNAWEVSNTGTEQPWSAFRFKIKVVRFMDEFSSARPLSCHGWFENIKFLHKIEGIENLNTSSVTDMSNMFYGCELLTSLDISGFNTSNVTDMHSMFSFCKSLKSLDLSNFDTSNVTDMISMFYGCEQLTSLDLSSFNTSSVTDMSCMFYQCYSLTSLNVSNFNTSNVKKMFGMFFYCESLLNLDLRSFNTSNVTDMCQMFWYCSALTTIYCNDDWQRINLVSKDMFKGCYELSGALEYSTLISMTDAKYANPETGYFTKVDTFDVKLAETSITTINSKDLTAIPGVTGKVSYDNRTKTLYLEDASITEMTVAGGYALRTTLDTLRINVVGDCSISSAAGTGVFANSRNVVIGGTGTLNVTAGGNGIVMNNTSSNTLDIDGKVTVNVTADNYGVQGREYNTGRIGLTGTTAIYYRTTLKVGGENSKLSVNGTKQCFQTLGGFTPAEGYKVTAPSRTAYYGTVNTFCKISVSFSGKELSGTTTTTLTPVAGTAVVIENPDANVETYQPGDVNHDGSITMADANMVVNYYLATTKPLDFDVTTADVNGDNDITMADANMIVNMYLNGGSSQTDGQTAEGHEYVDLGLSVKWAKCNIGAENPENYGAYFAWGETEPKDNYSWENYKWCNGSQTTLTKYNIDSDYGTVDNLTTLEIADDAAAANWGGAWRMPTYNELSALLDSCYWEWTTNYNSKGSGYIVYKVKNPDDMGVKKTQGSTVTTSATYSLSDAHIFLPAAGFREDAYLYVQSMYGYYRLASLDENYPSSAWYAYFGSGSVGRGGGRYGGRNRGCSVRPVHP
ncbi:MAG: BspA family leucine-rich repeat surface protein [Prevotella sp.]|nr:BspA family leucine-rich repeat surface protein [Prevotella sp.]